MTSPDYLSYVAKAKTLAHEKHAGQTDLIGAPYIDHVTTVVQLTHQATDNALCDTVAWLHDLIEDTDMTLSDLTEQGFPDIVVKAVSQLTHIQYVPYDAYIADITNPIAKKVKLSDLIHNSDIRRFGASYRDSPRDQKRLAKYARAIQTLARNQQQIDNLYKLYNNTIKPPIEAFL